MDGGRDNGNKRKIPLEKSLGRKLQSLHQLLEDVREREFSYIRTNSALDVVVVLVTLKRKLEFSFRHCIIFPPLDELVARSSSSDAIKNQFPNRISPRLSPDNQPEAPQWKIPLGNSKTNSKGNFDDYFVFLHFPL